MLEAFPAALPRPTRAGRIFDFFKEMFPPWVYAPYGFATFASVYFGIQALSGAETLSLGVRGIAGAVSTFLFLLLMRLYDELKDVETDLRLGRAGDPRYKDRPIVTGKIREEDLVWLRWAVSGLLVLINLPLGWPHPLAEFLLLFGAAWLSFKWFFWPAISKNLLLAFATHNPLTLVLIFYALGVALADHPELQLVPGTAALALAVWLPVAAWETSRKLRAPEDETDYQTYSMMLGARVAAMMPVAFLSVAAASLVWVAWQTGLSPAITVVAVGVAAVAVLACLRFVLRPRGRTDHLRMLAELYSLVATVGFCVALVVDRGLRFSAF